MSRVAKCRRQSAQDGRGTAFDGVLRAAAYLSRAIARSPVATGQPAALQIPQSLIPVSTRSESVAGRRRGWNHGRGASRGWRCIGEIRVIGPRIGPQVGHALHFEVGVSRWTSLSPVPSPAPGQPLWRAIPETVLHVGRPVEPSTVVEDCAIRFSAGSGGVVLDFPLDHASLAIHAGCTWWYTIQRDRRRRCVCTPIAVPWAAWWCRGGVCEVWVFGRRVRPQVRYALNLKVRVTGGAGFRPSVGANRIALLDDRREPFLHVGRPVEPSAIIEHRSIDLALRLRL